MKNFKLDRRTVLRGAGGAAVALPFLEAMAPGRKAYAASPKRFVVFFSPNGTVSKNRFCTGTERSFELSRILKPLEPMKKKIVVLEGLFQGNRGEIPGPGDDHMKGMAWMLTGRPLLSGSIPGMDGQPPAGLASGISIDQEIANKVGGGTRFKSLEFGVRSTFQSGNPLGYMVYAGSNQALAPEQDPSRMFFRVFGDFKPTDTGGGADSMQLAAERKGVVDAVKSSFDALSKKVGSADRIKLEQHMANIRDLEVRLTVAPSAGCALPKGPREDLDPFDSESFGEVGKSHQDIMVEALKCNLTRVASIQWSRSAGDPIFRELGATRGHHEMSHDGDGVAATQETLTKIDTWYAERFNELITKMDSVVESDGKTMLDNSLVLWVNELARGNMHTHIPLSFVVAGGAGGALETGRFLRFNEPHNNLLVSCLNLMGIEATTFGEPGQSTGPFKGLA